MPEYVDYIARLMQNLSLIVTLILIQGLLAPYLAKLNTRLQQIINGMAFGLVTLIGMMLPVSIATGVQIDPKAIIVFVATVSGGPVTGGIAMLFGLTGRAYLGGTGIVPGMATVVISWAFGLVMYGPFKARAYRMSTLMWLLSGIVLGVLMLALIFMLPEEIRWGVYAAYAVPVMIYYPLSTFLIGMVYSLKAARWAANQALVASDQRYRSLVEYGPDAILVLQNGRIVFVNPQAAVLLHALSVEDLVGRPIMSVLHPEVHETVRQHIATLMATGEPAPPLAEKYLRDDGSTVDVEVTAIKCDYLGSPAIQVQARDITRRLQLEQRLDMAIDGANLGVWDWDINANKIVFSERWTTMLGYADDDISSDPKSWERIVHRQDIDRVKTELNAHLEGRTTMYRSEHRLLNKSGAWRWMLVQGCVVARDAQGRPTRVVGTQMDIDSRKRAEARVAESEERARRYFNLGLIGMATTAPNKDWVEVNDELCRMLGYSREELADKTWADVTHPEDLQKDVDQFNRVLSGESDGYTLDKRYLRKDGSIVHANVAVAATRDKGGQVQHFVALVQDLTDRYEAERHRKLMVSELDHRVKNNLATVLAILDQTRAGTTDIEQFVTAFRGRVRSLARTHEALARSHWSTVSMREVADLVLAPFAHDEHARISMAGDDFQLAARLCMPMSMTLHELLTNATKYGALSNDIGRIQVTWSIIDHHRVQLTWREWDGPAVTPPTHRGSGTDLIEGLVCYEMQGQVNVDYQPQGLICTIELPITAHVKGSVAN